MLFEKEGDITKQQKDVVIAHCISCDCAMGAGVVIPIRNKYPGLKDACIKYVQSTKDPLGTAFRYETDYGVCYNLFTKRDVRANYLTLQHRYLTALRFSLIDLREQMKNHNETKLAIPKIGAGLDRCNWEDVKAIIEDVFKDEKIYIKVVLYENQS